MWDVPILEAIPPDSNLLLHQNVLSGLCVWLATGRGDRDRAKNAGGGSFRKGLLLIAPTRLEMFPIMAVSSVFHNFRVLERGKATPEIVCPESRIGEVLLERSEPYSGATGRIQCTRSVGKESHSRSGKNLREGRPKRVFDRQRVAELRSQGLG